MKNKFLQSGNIALITLLIVITVSLSVGLSLYVMALNNLKWTFGDRQSQQALALVESCLEDLYLRIGLDNNYSTSYLSIPTGSCSVNIVANGNDRVITIEGSKNNYYKKIEASLTIQNGGLIQNYWKEI